MHIGNIPIRRGSKQVYGATLLPWEMTHSSVHKYFIHTILVDSQLFYVLYIPHDFNHWAIHVHTGHVVDISSILTDPQYTIPSPPIGS